MSSGGRLISRIPGEGLSVIPVVEGGTPTSAMIAGAQAVTPFSFVPSWTGTKAELLAQIDADPTVLVDDGPRFSAYLSKIIELGHPLAYRGMIYINSYNPVTVAGRNVDLRQFGDGCIVGGPDLDNRLLKIINTSGDFARVADCHIDGLKFNVEKCAPGALNSINCFEPSGFRTVLIENCDFYHGEFYQTGGGDSGVLLSCANATLRNNRVQGAVDLGFYITGSNDGLQDNRNLIIEGNTFVNCANGWSAKRNYRYVRSVGNHYVGCRNGSSITATPVGGTGLGTIGGAFGIMAAETHENCGASCIDLRDTHGWNVQCTVAGTFGYDKDGVAIASACIVKLDDSDNCRVDFVAEVTSTDVTHAAVRIQNGSVNNVVNGTVKGIYNGLIEANGNYNNVTLKLDADVTVPGTIFGADTQFAYDQAGVRSYYVGIYDRLPGRAPSNPVPLPGPVVFNVNTAGRTVAIEPGASSVKAILPVAVNGDEVTIHKTAASGVGLIQVRDPTDTTTIHNIVDAGAMASFRYGPNGWIFLSRSISDRTLPLVTVAAANVATPPNNCKTLFIDSADGAVKAKDSAGQVGSYHPQFGVATSAQINSAPQITFERGAVVTLLSSDSRITMLSGSHIDLNGGKIVFDYSDTTNTTNCFVHNAANGIFELATTRVIERFLTTIEDGGEFNNITVRSIDHIANDDDNDDAAWRVSGSNNRFKNINFDRFDVQMRLYGNYNYLSDASFTGYTKALILDGCSGFRGRNLNFVAPSPNALQEPGHNAIFGGGGGASDTQIIGFRVGDLGVGGSGEHGVYFSAETGAEAVGLLLSDGWIYNPGQCGIKVRGTKEIYIQDVHVRDTSWNNLPGTNEDGFRFERSIGVYLNYLSVAGLSTTNGGYYGMLFRGSRKVRASAISLQDSFSHGLVIASVTSADGHGADSPSGDIMWQGAIRNAGGAAIFFDHADQTITDDIVIDVVIDGAIGAPVDLSGVGAIASGKKIVIRGTYKNCGAALPVTTNPQIDLSGLVDFDSIAGSPDMRSVLPVDGGTTSIDNGNYVETEVLFTHTSTIAAHTVVFPPNPRDGQKLTLLFVSVITTLTLSSPGVTRYGTFASAGAVGAHASWRYRAATNAWHKLD